MLCFKKTTLPKTPFVLSLILSICDSDDFTPINEAVIMEQFMEYLLEKTSPLEARSTSFDFRIKEDFLVNLVTIMDLNNRFLLSIDEFNEFVSHYHEEKGFSEKETRFASLFFEKGVLVRIDDNITFRYNCMIEYYLAKRAEQTPEFLNHILANRNYLNYSNELMYYTGLNRKDINVVKQLEQDLFSDFEKYRGVVTELENYNIGISISLPEENFMERLNNTKLSQEQSDKLQDTGDTSELLTPEDIDRADTHEDKDSFIRTLLIYGSCLKNLELLPVKEKETMYHNYCFGLCIMLGIIKKTTEEFFSNEVYEMELLPEKYTAEDVQKAKVLMEDVLKISIPLVLQNIALENMGTTKLRTIIDGVIHDNNSSEFSRFFSVFTFSDLHLSGLKKVLSDYVSSANNKSLLKIIFIKLLYYYRFRYFSSSLDPFFENILADINIKLNGLNNFKKSSIIASYRKEKRFDP